VIIVDVFVPGAAKTKGSMEVRNRATGAMKESVAGSSRWRALMAQAVRDDIARRNCTGGDRGYNCEHRAPFNCGDVEPYPGAVSVTVEAYLPPPVIKWPTMPWHWPIWTRAGDLDKLVRNVLDAIGSTSRNTKMNGNAIVDDNLVCRIVASKHVADGKHYAQAGVRIVVETL
jgi:hypothetical protein